MSVTSYFLSIYKQYVYINTLIISFLSSSSTITRADRNLCESRRKSPLVQVLSPLCGLQYLEGTLPAALDPVRL